MPLVISQFGITMPHISLATVIVTLVVSPFAVTLLHMVERVVRAALSSSRIVPGPPGGSLVFGQLGFILDANKASWHKEAVAKYGHVVRYRAILGVRLSHICPKA